MEKLGWKGMGALFAALAALPAAPAVAQDASQEQLNDRLQKLEQELAVVKRQLEVKQEETYRLRLRGYVQSDGRL